MSVELISVLIAVLAIGVAQSGLILTSNRGLRQRTYGKTSRGWSRGWMRGSMGWSPRSANCASAWHMRSVNSRERMAKLEGLLEGLREAISGRAAAS